MRRLYITNIIAHNFQSCKHCEVTLNEYLNVVCGESDSGKTTMFKRVLMWVLYNDLSGDFFVRDNDEGKVNSKGELIKEDDCYGTVVFNTGAQITRRRKKSKNIYEVIDENGEFFPFENFGNTVPDKVQEITKMIKLVVDKDISLNVNIPEKKEKNVLYMSDGNKAKVIGSFAGTNVIDAAVRDVKTDNKGFSSKIKFIEEDISKINNSLKVYGDMEYKEKRIDYCETLIKQKCELEDRIILLTKLKQSILDKKELISELDKQISLKKLLSIEETRLSELDSIIKDKLSIFNKQNKIFEELNRLNDSILMKKKQIKEEELLIKGKDYVLEQEKKLMKLELKMHSNNTDFLKYSQKYNVLLTLRDSLTILHNKVIEDSKIISKKDHVFSDETLLLEKEKYLIDTRNKFLTISKELIDIEKTKTVLIGLKKNIELNKKNILNLNKVISSKESLLEKEIYITSLLTKINVLSTNYTAYSNKLLLLTELKKELDFKKEKEIKGVPILNKMKRDLDLVIDQCVRTIEQLGKCPVCYSNLTPEHLQNVKYELLR